MTTSLWKNSILSGMEKIGMITLLQNTGNNDRNKFYVLTYHRVEDVNANPWLSRTDISTSPALFNEQMQMISRKYHPVTVEQILDASRGGKMLPKDAVLVTVDDGYHSFYDTIQPTCEKYGISPLLFLATGFVEKGTFWWDKVHQIIYFSGCNELDTPVGPRSIAAPEQKEVVFREVLQALKKMPFNQLTGWVDSTHSALVHLPESTNLNTVTWTELRELTKKGVTVASHTHSHPMMSQIPLEEARQEVILSQQIIERELGKALPVFAFPDGKSRAVNQAALDMLSSEGFELVFLLQDGRARLHPENRFHTFPRMAVWPDQTLPQFHLRLTPLIDRISS